MLFNKSTKDTFFENIETFNLFIFLFFQELPVTLVTEYDRKWKTGRVKLFSQLFFQAEQDFIHRNKRLYSVTWDD